MSRRRRRIVIAGVIGVAVVALAVIAWPGDTRRMRGTWTGPAGRLTVDGDLMVLDLPGGTGPRRTYFRLEPFASPKRITLWDADTPGTGRRFLGIEVGPPEPSIPGSEMRGLYELDGNTLRFCLSPPGAGLPAALDPAAGAVFEFRRE